MIRDFLMLLRRYTASSVLNIIGMALAFASAYIILVQVNFDMSYNRKIPNAENIYRMDKPSLIKEGMWSTLNNRYDPSEVCEHVPGIIGVTSMGLYRADIAFRFVINRPNGSNTLKAQMALIERSGLDVFSFTAVAGLFDQFIGPRLPSSQPLMPNTMDSRLGMFCILRQLTPIMAWTPKHPLPL